MRILLIGYGKMGKIIDSIASERGYEIVGRINSKNKESLSEFNKGNTDLAIEFTNPDVVFDNLVYCVSKGIAVVTGTTGWYDRLEELKSLSSRQEHKTAVFYASNFSIGVNIFMKVNDFLAKIMNGYEDYDLSMQEIHHTQKLDSPSGTAITLAEGIVKGIDRKKKWALSTDADLSSEDLSIEALRIPDVPGTHTIQYKSSIDEITIEHKAYNREGFAKGVVSVSEWLEEKEGFFTMDDFFKIE